MWIPLKKVEAVGYSISELKKIESYFESTYIIPDDDKDGFLGLMCVVDCLMDIHECNIDEINNAKSLFKKDIILI